MVVNSTVNAQKSKGSEILSEFPATDYLGFVSVDCDDNDNNYDDNNKKISVQELVCVLLKWNIICFCFWFIISPHL